MRVEVRLAIIPKQPGLVEIGTKFPIICLGSIGPNSKLLYKEVRVSLRRNQFDVEGLIKPITLIQVVEEL